MIMEPFKENENTICVKNTEMLLFGFSVSMDAFSVGISLSEITSNYLISSIIFSVVSFIFTLSGLIVGKKINKIVGKLATIVGGIFLIIMAILYLI